MEYACTKLQSEAFAWRFPVGFQVIFLLLILIVIPFYPESPRHLAKQGRLKEAHDLLSRCRVDSDPVKIKAEMDGIVEALRLEATSTAHSFRSMLFQKDRLHTQRRIILGGGIQVLQKLTGTIESLFWLSYAPRRWTC